MTPLRSLPSHLHRVNVGQKCLADYRSTLVAGMYDEIMALAEGLRGKRVLHVSATAFGGGVAEIMYTLIPLMRDVGVDAEWAIMHGEDPFFDVTKLLHNSLQGAEVTPDEEQWETWREYQRINARLIDASQYDVVVMHDPQPLGMREVIGDVGARWIWRCHIDLSTPNPATLAILQPHIDLYDATLFHMPQYVPDGLSPKVHIVPPAIDPLAPKNMALPAHDAAYIVRQFGIDVDRPLMCQVSRFDPWKDPMGVIDAWWQVRQEFPGTQLALVGSMANDDPEGQEYWDRTVEYAQDDRDIHILSNLSNVGAVEVNAFQVVSSVVLQKSVREGFGLTVSEALWKARPVVAGDVGGIRIQIENGVTGYLVSSAEEAASCSIDILRDPAAAESMAAAGKEVVRQHYLTPRYLRDHLQTYSEALGIA